MKLKKTLTTIVLFLCMGFGTFFLLAWAMIGTLVSENHKEFNPNLWKDDFEGDTRPSMLIDLENEHLKKGMTKVEVIKLLGEPDGRLAEEQEIGYNLGIDTLDPCEFIIRFDENQHLVSFSNQCAKEDCR